MTPTILTHKSTAYGSRFMSLLISIYAINNFDNFKVFASKNTEQDYLEMIGIGVLHKYIDPAIAEGNLYSLQTSHRLTRAILRILEQIAS